MDHIALDKIDADRLDRVNGLLVLNMLGYGTNTDRLADVVNRLNNRTRERRGADLAYEAAVNFYTVYR